MKNLTAIVWLYRGEAEKYQALLEEYQKALGNAPFAETLTRLQGQLKDLQKQAKETVESANRREKKRIQAQFDEEIAAKNAQIVVAKEAVWLYEKFGAGEYQDIPGLCKIADRETILEEKGCSLTPGAYVGVTPVDDDGVDIAQRMSEIHRELLALQTESNALMDTISRNWEEMGI